MKIYEKIFNALPDKWKVIGEEGGKNIVLAMENHGLPAWYEKWDHDRNDQMTTPTAQFIIEKLARRYIDHIYAKSVKKYGDITPAGKDFCIFSYLLPDARHAAARLVGSQI